MFQGRPTSATSMSPAQLHFVTFLCVINAHLLSFSSWLLFENFQTCTALEKHTHTHSLGAMCFPLVQAAPQMGRGAGRLLQGVLCTQDAC